MFVKNPAKPCLSIAFLCMMHSLAFSQCGLTLTFTEGPQTSPPNLDCANDCDGTILIIPTPGGQGPFTYVWSTSPPQTAQAATGLCAGTYTVSITDGAACLTVAVDSIVAPSPVTAVFTDILACNGQCNGVAILNVGGGCSGSGTCSYPYIWTNLTTSTTVIDTLDSILSFTGLCPGDYSISVTDIIPCPATIVNVTITEASAMTPTISGNDVTCPGLCNGTSTVTVTGGLQPYTFNWSDGQSSSNQSAGTIISGLCAGPYDVTITDTLGCTVTESIIIEEPLPIAFTAAIVDPTCNGGCNGSITLTTPTGGFSPYSYQWSTIPAQTNITATGLCGQVSYSVTVSDLNLCNEIETYVLNQSAVLETNVIVTCSSVGNDLYITATIEILNGTAPYTYIWSNGAVSSLITGVSIGETYDVTITDGSGCDGQESLFIGTDICPIEIIIPNTFSPNEDGFNDTWIIENLSIYSDAEVKVYNRWGDIVFTSTGYDTPWKGKFGATLPAAVYYYVIIVESINQTYAGSVTIVK